MKINWLKISIVVLLYFSNNVYAFSFGEFQSRITIDEAISIAKQNKRKLTKFENTPDSYKAVQYFLDDERYDILLEFSKHSNQLFSLSITAARQEHLETLMLMI